MTVPTISSVVTKRGATKSCNESTAQRSVNQRPRQPLQRSTCAPSADSSIGDVSLESGIEEVAQRGGLAAWEFMRACYEPTLGASVGPTRRQA